MKIREVRVQGEEVRVHFSEVRGQNVEVRIVGSAFCSPPEMRSFLNRNPNRTRNRKPSTDYDHEHDYDYEVASFLSDSSPVGLTSDFSPLTSKNHD